MGCFSWHKVDTGYNVQNNKGFKLLIPKVFADEVGFDSVGDVSYLSYGYIGRNRPDGPPDRHDPKYDIYELLAIWNAPEQCKFTHGYSPMKTIDEDTRHNRNIGINIGCYAHEMAKLKYPLRLVDYHQDGKYEDFDDLMSINDSLQGWGENRVGMDEMSISKTLNNAEIKKTGGFRHG